MPADPRRMAYVVEIVAKGRSYLYFRRGKFRARLHGEPGSAEFFEHYTKLLRGDETVPSPVTRGSVADLVRSYATSAPDFTRKLAPKTQRDYLRMLDHLRPIEEFRARDVRRVHIIKLRDGLAATPRTADLFIAAVRRCFRYGLDHDFCEVNPAAEISQLAKSTRYKRWRPEDIAAFLNSDPCWTMRRALLVGYHIGARRAAAVKLMLSQIRGGTLTYEPGKNGETAVVPIAPALATDIEETPVATLMLMPQPDGRAWTDRAFSDAFREACDNAGLRNLHFHGLRHTVGSEAAEAGATEAEIQALLGHKTRAMAAHYSQQAGRAKLGMSAARRRQRSGEREQNEKV